MKNNELKETTPQEWRAYLYLRLSKEDGDKEESDSIKGQRDILRTFVSNTPGITIVGEKVDDGFRVLLFSGRRLSK